MAEIPVAHGDGGGWPGGHRPATLLRGCAGLPQALLLPPRGAGAPHGCIPGLAKIPFTRFFIATFIGAYIWCTLLIGAGYLLGHEWMLISDFINNNLLLIISAGLFIIPAYLPYHFRSHLAGTKWLKFTKDMESN